MINLNHSNLQHQQHMSQMPNPLFYKPAMLDLLPPCYPSIYVSNVHDSIANNVEYIKQCFSNIGKVHKVEVLEKMPAAEEPEQKEQKKDQERDQEKDQEKERKIKENHHIQNDKTNMHYRMFVHFEYWNRDTCTDALRQNIIHGIPTKNYYTHPTYSKNNTPQRKKRGREGRGPTFYWLLRGAKYSPMNAHLPLVSIDNNCSPKNETTTIPTRQETRIDGCTDMFLADSKSTESLKDDESAEY